MPEVNVSSLLVQCSCSCENNVRLFNLVVYVVDNLLSYILYSFLLKEIYVAHCKTNGKSETRDFFSHIQLTD